MRLRDPHTREARWFVPGGALEPGETPEAAAIRETLEETGYRVVIDARHELVVRYPFEWNGLPFDVTTHFFRASLAQPDAAPARVDDASYHEGVAWLPLDELEDALGFHAGIHEAVRQLL